MWRDLGVAIQYTPCASGTLILTGNADLWTANAGVNQDVGIFAGVSSIHGGIPNQLVAWKESGGYAGTFSPNAAFVQATYSVTAGAIYTFVLKWKSNKYVSGATIYAGAGPIGGLFSPTRLTLQQVPSVFSSSSTQQYSLASNNGSSWAEIDPAQLTVSLAPAANATILLGANADLWTADAGYNQDLGIFVSVNGGPDQLVAWKESGGFAGTFSPNAAFVQAVYNLSSGSSYVFKLKWKANKDATGATIYAGAGPISGYSPTSLTAQFLT
jgi:hypothetical protein